MLRAIGLALMLIGIGLTFGIPLLFLAVTFLLAWLDTFIW